MLRVQPEVERKERETDAVVLLHVPQLVSPQPLGGLEREDDDVSEGDRGVVPTRQDEMRETAVGHVEEAAVAETRTREREPAEDVSDRVGVVGDELARDAIARCYRPPPAQPR